MKTTKIIEPMARNDYNISYIHGQKSSLYYETEQIFPKIEIITLYKETQ
jgi:hypothetical protein